VVFTFLMSLLRNISIDFKKPYLAYKDLVSCQVVAGNVSYLPKTPDVAFYVARHSLI
jgi:hypothetical protein